MAIEFNGKSLSGYCYNNCKQGFEFSIRNSSIGVIVSETTLSKLNTLKLSELNDKTLGNI